MTAFEEWTLVDARPGKRIYSRFDANGDMIIMEEWDDDVALTQAAQQREVLDSAHKDFKPLGVIPDSVRARAMREGWYFDEAAWKRWLNDRDNYRLRITDGMA